jgi:hypothetical protein
VVDEGDVGDGSLRFGASPAWDDTVARPFMVDSGNDGGLTSGVRPGSVVGVGVELAGKEPDEPSERIEDDLRSVTIALRYQLLERPRE